jgi:hypothetical protein
VRWGEACIGTARQERHVWARFGVLRIGRNGKARQGRGKLRQDWTVESRSGEVRGGGATSREGGICRPLPSVVMLANFGVGAV